MRTGINRARRRPTTGIALLFPLMALMAACAGPAHVSTGGGASCASLAPAKQLAKAQIAFVGIMLRGPTVKLGGQQVLRSPARVRVTRYLKGTGPAIVSVTTAISHAGDTANAEGIEPQPGQQWAIYTSSRHTPYQTSICDGSTPAGGQA
jgi:hypothetical protein